jgi:gamma-glutamyltranspeptidase/glutathione hydrolase
MHHPTKSTVPFIAVLLSAFLATLTGCGPKWQLAPMQPPPPVTAADSGMVVAAHPLAAEAGLAVLKDGGNAVDAAIATMFVLNVVEPHASGLGGGGFALVRMAGGESLVVDYRDRAPRAVDTGFYYNPLDSLKHLRHGGTAVCVPGAASGWAELLDRYGSMPLDRLTRDAIRLAEEGFPVSGGLSRVISDYRSMILEDSSMKKVFLNDTLPLASGDTLRQPGLAETFKWLNQHGLRSFYRGPIAEAVVASVRADSGYMTLEDLEFYRAQIAKPVTGSINGLEILTIPPPAAGGATLIEALNLIQATKATASGLTTPASIHLTAQCIQQAYADAEARIGDPEVATTNWREMLSPEFAAKAAAGISATAKPAPRLAVPPSTSDHGNTTHLVVVDKQGNAVSITQSINYFFGAGVMAGSTGILLNNQMADFSVMPDSLNLLGPRKRPRSNMTPIIAVKEGKPILVLGTPGGARITSTMIQILLGAEEGGMDISAAIDYPRYFPTGEHLVLETRFPLETFKALNKLGYILHPAGPYHYYFGGAHGIAVTPEGKLNGSADKRRGGAARGY